MIISRVQLNHIIREETHRLLEVYTKKQRGAMCAWANSPASENPKGLSNKEAGEQCRGPMKETEDGSPWTDDEKQERHISHVAEKEARELVTQFRKSLKQDVGRVWGDDAVERREEEAVAAAIESSLPQLDTALELPAGEERDDEVKRIVYVLDNLQPGFYKPSKQELEGFANDPSKAGAPANRRLTGTIPRLGIDLSLA
mgnify:FL=1|jgi:hypothetical protein|tara:strand:- start:2426 stop:3025 length:600 start_codon:yes stop_codon:yes gene_type:complete